MLSRPLIISRHTTPKLYTSTLSLSWPSVAYSGAKYPLHTLIYIKHIKTWFIEGPMSSWRDCIEPILGIFQNHNLVHLWNLLCIRTTIYGANAFVRGEMVFFGAYLVPATCTVIRWLSSSGNNKANPKSATLGSRFLSNKMLLALTSRWITLGRANACK